MRKQDFTVIDVTQPKDGYTVILNSYWLCKEGLPQQAIFYKGVYPQCNKNKLMAEYAGKRYMDYFDYFVQIVLIPIAYVKPLI